MRALTPFLGSWLHALEGGGGEACEWGGPGQSLCLNKSTLHSERQPKREALGGPSRHQSSVGQGRGPQAHCSWAQGAACCSAGLGDGEQMV